MTAVSSPGGQSGINENDAMRYKSDRVGSGDDSAVGSGGGKGRLGGRELSPKEGKDDDGRVGKNWEGQAVETAENLAPPNPKTRRGNRRENLAPPNSEADFAPPRKRERGKAKSQSKTWIEFKPGTKRKDGSRLYYPKRRKWKAGNKTKEWVGPVEELGPMTKKEKDDYVKEQRKLKARRKRRENRTG